VVARSGFRWVELEWDVLHRQILGPQGDVAGLHELLRDYQLVLGAVYLGSVTAERVDQVTLQVRKFREELERLAELKCPTAIIAGGNRTLENFNALRDGLNQLTEAGRALGVTVALANKCQSRIEDRRDLLAMFTGSEPSQARLCLDVYECHLAAVNPAEVVMEHGARLGLVRLADVMGTAPVQLGRGELELRGLVRQLRKAKYDGLVVLDDRFVARNPHPVPVLEEARLYADSLLA